MKQAEQIVFRHLTAADFFNINKPRGSERRGGGQSYIDFPTSAVPGAAWAKFFAGLATINTFSGPMWRFTVNSIGIERSQTAEIGRRRPQSYNIRAQKLGTRLSNRVFAWHPDYGFPEPADPSERRGVPNLVIYLIRTTGGEFWAGWFQAAYPSPMWAVDPRLEQMFTRDDGYVLLNPAIDFDEADGRWPFQGAAAALHKPAVSEAFPASVGASAQPARASRRASPRYRQKAEEQVIDELFSNDLSPETTKEKWKVVRTVLKRNEKAVGALKELYGGRCQLTGEKYVFKKTDGRFYCEAHHLYPLGEGGADSPHNLIIVSPLIHRMFHYAEVTGLDLSKIFDDKLEIRINGEPFTITWHPKHAEFVAAAARKGR